MARNRSGHRPSAPQAAKPASQRQALQNQAIAAVIQQTQIHQGPLPHPDVLRGYERTVPGAAERIIAMAEAESAHRHKLEAIQLAADVEVREKLADIEARRHGRFFRSDLVGQALGTLVSIGALTGAAWTSYVGLNSPNLSVAFWFIPAAFLSLPVMGMVKAIRGRPSPVSSNAISEDLDGNLGG